ncbi:MAG: hypothetical protein ACE14W_02100 [Candidatus Velamenicoccus archaeovorus]
MTRAGRAAALLATMVLLVPACTGSGGGPPSPEGPVSPVLVPASPETPSPPPDGPGSALAALERLCPRPPAPPPSGVTPEGPTPPAIRTVEDQIQQVRELRFVDPVAVDAVDHDEMVHDLEASFDESYPASLYRRRSLAWQTLGAIPPGTDLRAVLERFAGSQVIGFYDTLTKQLVFLGGEEPSPYERVTLAHELTHALDDQHFGLSRVDHLGITCRDEAAEAAVGAVEGSATYFMLAYAQRFLSIQEQLQVGLQTGPSTAGIPPFVLQTQTWPYTAGLGFMQAMDARGGIEAIDRALQHFPLSTEQVMHPERYPNDVPTPVDVPQVAAGLGPGWKDLDVMEVGEAFLSILLGLRIDGTTAASAAEGWDGGIYRAWSDGDRVALELSTVWDTSRDASEFASAMDAWIGTSQPAVVLPVQGRRVRVLFGSDAPTLELLQRAAA